MRTLSILALAIITITTSCTRPGETETPTTITGKWKYISYYMDPGDGSGTWKPAPADQTFVDFRPDKTINTDIQGLTQYHSYEMKGDSLITFFSKNNSPITMGLRFKENTMEILPPCIEGCGLRFKK